MKDVPRMIYYFVKEFKYEDTHNEIKNLGTSNISSETIRIFILILFFSNNGLISGYRKLVERRNEI